MGCNFWLLYVKIDTCGTFRSVKNKTYIFPVALLIDTKRGALSIDSSKDLASRSRWPCGLRRKSAAARLQGCSSLVFVVCYVGIGLCEEFIARSEESYRVCVCVCVCVRARGCTCACARVCLCVCDSDQTRRPRPEFSCCATAKKMTL